MPSPVLSAWFYSRQSRNYEIVWRDDAVESAEWVQEEFDSLWRDHAAVPLVDVVIEEIERLSRRRVIAHLPDWRDVPEPDPAGPIVEVPVYRKENGSVGTSEGLY